MALTNAERQARYRAARKIGSTEDQRLNLYISKDACGKLGDLAKGYGVTKREILDRLITEEYQQVVGSLVVDSPVWDAFFAKWCYCVTRAQNPHATTLR